MTTKTTVVVIDDIADPMTLIEIDPYRRDTCAAAAVQLVIMPGQRRAYLETYSPCQAVPMSVWNRLVLALPVTTHGGPVDGPAMVAMLRGDEIQSLLARVCDGHSVEWDGSNLVGTMTDDATDALSDLGDDLESAPALESGGIVAACYWVDESSVIADYGITPDTTDERLTDIAADMERVAAGDFYRLQRLDGYLDGIRARLREAAE